VSGSITDLFRKAKSIPVDKLVAAIFALTQEKRGGRFVHEHQAILDLVKRAKL
jgi:hypothetical protein